MTQTDKLLRELIAIPSVNPAYAPPQDPNSGEQRLAQYLLSLARKSGLDAELRWVLPGRPNLFVKVSPSGKVTQRIILAPHLDTVGAKTFKPMARADRLYGRGACDTKGSVAAMFTALQELVRQGPRPANTELLFVGLIDEECGQTGSRALVDAKCKADLAIVGEPTRLQVVTAHKGVLWLELLAHGTAAHGSHPELGRNAVHLMARIVDALQTSYSKKIGRRSHPLLGHATINVGAISGGTQPNIVPADCRIQLDRRMLPGETESEVVREIRQIVQEQTRVAMRLPLPKVTLHKSHIIPPPFSVKMRKWQRGPCLAIETDPKLPLVQQFFSCARQETVAGVDFFSDAGVLAHGKIPSVLFGPGDIAQAHKPDEWISLSQLEQGKDLLLRFLHSLA